ncbi:hypothetical protein C7460_10775 [Marinoscillum furvescens DSM 4134]|uniref:Uncharacterized protein n=1 Tax=Marinoscillum furvescens DSM 4134 TaxID=1122208 RepID=A0A3D9L3H4_MARFU|nr:hypothetical protein C7460_10775 [Marinoscillum furvescens DSM 4134]
MLYYPVCGILHWFRCDFTNLGSVSAYVFVVSLGNELIDLDISRKKHCVAGVFMEVNFVRISNICYF